MTGQKNRFSTTEKLWNLDDKQLKTPKHDAMVLWLMDKKNLYPLLTSAFVDEYIIDVDNFPKEKFVYDTMVNAKVNLEVPLMSSPTFIAGYADLVVDFIYRKFKEYVEFPLTSEICDEIKNAAYVEDLEQILSDFKNEPNAKLEKHFLDERCFKKVCIDNDGSKNSKEKLVDPEYYPNDFYGLGYDLKLYLFLRNVGFEISPENVHRWRLRGFWHRFEESKFKCLIEVKPYIDSFGAVLRQLQSYDKFWKSDSGVPYTNGWGFLCLFTLDTRFDSQFESQGIPVLHPPSDVTIEDMIEEYGLE